MAFARRIQGKSHFPKAHYQTKPSYRFLRPYLQVVQIAIQPIIIFKISIEQTLDKCFQWDGKLRKGLRQYLAFLY